MGYLKYIEQILEPGEITAICRPIFTANDTRYVPNVGDQVWHEEEPYRVIDKKVFYYKKMHSTDHRISHIEIIVERA